MVTPQTFSNFLISPPKRHAVKLSKSAQAIVKQGHPWIFKESIAVLKGEPSSGDLAIVFDNYTDKVIGIGCFDMQSPIKIKMLYNEGSQLINEDFFKSRIEKAYRKRLPLLETDTNAYRLVFGENDGLPALIADVYDHILVLKLYSEMWWPYLQNLLPLLINCCSCKTVVLRLSRQLQRLPNPFNLKDGDVLYGKLPKEVIQFKEHGIFFSANVIKGHKTGYFLDHRHNRKEVGVQSQGKTVLDVFSYAGGFSVHALANGAKHVTSVDISEHALEVAKSNAKLNDYDGTHHCIAGDAFEVLDHLIKSKKTFDIVVIDPPSFAKKASDVSKALKKYGQLARLGCKLTANNGLLVLASCSSRVVAQSFFENNESTMRREHCTFEVLDYTYHDIDHPIGFLEGAYLKTAYYRIKKAAN